MRRDIVVIGASSGGLQVLQTIVGGLPQNFPAAIFVVVHIAPEAKSHLPAILMRSGALPAKHAQDNEAIQLGHIYVAPPDFHLLLRNGKMRVLRGPKENFHRPAIDPLFRSAARFFGPRTIGIVLSGGQDDGAAGLFSIKSHGGLAIVQDPNDAPFPEMPANALLAATVDFQVPAIEIANLIINLTGGTDLAETAQASASHYKEDDKETAVGVISESIADDDTPGTPSVYGCPDCGGALWEYKDDEWLRFRCRVGHAYSAEGLLNGQSRAVESALWNAFRALHENAALARRIAKRARDNNQIVLASKFEQRSAQGEEEAKLIRDLLLTSQEKHDNSQN